MKKYASISIDLDHESDYAQVYGINSYQSKKEYMYTQSIPRLLDLLDSIHAKATFFIIGRDLKIPTRLKHLRTILERGHELANHTFNHHHNFHLLTREAKEEEIVKTHEVIFKKLRYKLQGFRAPGYNIDPETIQILESLGYLYDSSIHPTIMHPVLRLALLLKTKQLSSWKSMGPTKAILAPNRPYRCKLNDITCEDKSSSFVEIPISVYPVLRMPWFGTIDLHLGKMYFQSMFPLRLLLQSVNYEIHGIDLIDSPIGKLSWFKKHPGINKLLQTRLDIYQNIFNYLASEFSLIPLKEVAQKTLNAK